jgi:hypothetical protein
LIIIRHGRRVSTTAALKALLERGTTKLIIIIARSSPPQGHPDWDDGRSTMTTTMTTT